MPGPAAQARPEVVLPNTLARVTSTPGGLRCGAAAPPGARPTRTTIWIFTRW
ncbi:hypothetical protein [Deinococcus hopiensis]|uniref:hypothetical protein n=1 Tax=Deinococcus hopiensis TaxID=309885 RepID=UPI0014828FBF|nr:hypothetical protein [Deinococcus hopiensis]